MVLFLSVSAVLELVDKLVAFPLGLLHRRMLDDMNELCSSLSSRNLDKVWCKNVVATENWRSSWICAVLDLCCDSRHVCTCIYNAAHYVIMEYWLSLIHI